MAETPLSSIRACVFDAYGTLFDFASAAEGCHDLLGDKAGRLTADGATSSCNTAGCAPFKDACRLLAGHRRGARFRAGDAGRVGCGYARPTDAACLELDAFAEVPEVSRHLQ